GSSAEFEFGVRKKFKVGSCYSLGWELNVRQSIFKIKQADGKTFPDTLLNKAERMEFTSLGLGWFNRFNFDTKRGNYMGTFLDVGIFGYWDFAATHIVKNDRPDGSNVKAEFSHLPYILNTGYAVFARAGWSHLSCYAK